MAALRTDPFLTPDGAGQQTYAAADRAVAAANAAAVGLVVAAAADGQLGVTRALPSFLTVLVRNAARAAARVARP